MNTNTNSNNTLDINKKERGIKYMKENNKKEIAVIKLTAPNGEVMYWETSIKHINGKKVEYLDVAKASFAHDLVNKSWLKQGKAIQRPFEDDYIIAPIAQNRDELYRKKQEMRKEVLNMKREIIATQLLVINKKRKRNKVNKIWYSPSVNQESLGM